MSDLHPPPPDPPTNGSSNPSADPTSPSLLGPIPTPTAAPSSSAAVPTTTTTTAKRQRRPSVRLGDIGEQPAASDAFIRRSKHLKLPPPLGPTPSSSSKNPPLSLKPRSQSHHLDPLPHSPDAHNPLSSSLLRRPNPNPNHNKSRRARRSRSAWASSSSKPADEEEDEGFRSEFDDLRRDRDDSLSPSDRDHLDGGGRDWPADDNLDNGTLGMDEVGGVRSWLNRLGLGRYAPVFEIHEVDDEVLPLLTLEDLKDMGINAVGSRRKMFWAIQKLKKNFYNTVVHMVLL